MGHVDLNDLDARARAGEPRALLALGKRMLVGDGLRAAPAEAATLLQKAAAGGDAEAAAQLSVCTAWGVGLPRDVAAALDYLQRAAELGWQPAQQELRVLARHGGSDWTALRRAIDIGALTAPLPVRVVSREPRIVVIDAFCSPDECTWLIERARPHLQRALVYRGSPSAQAADSRTNTEAAFTIFRADVVLNLIRERMAAVARTSTLFFEVTKLLHYDPGEQFGLHADFLQLNTPELVREVELRGQRAATFLTYLNDGYEGGETDFPRIGYRYKGARGDALLFSNVDAAGAPDYSTVHTGLAPVTGEKWLLSQWVRSKPVG
ncbi:2OG-Fe(II) oxygenase [Povalibacter sp.]|uniref:2OG-Fe(II) oxygenase n=1 Tax=Povalibacter sp. TaxID=1962978 RepID=UPI002F427E44